MYDLGGMLRDPNARRRLVQHVAGDASAAQLRCIKMKLTSRCNLRCTMCRYWRIGNQQIPKQLVQSALDSAAELGCKKVHFSGGEVTLYEALVELITHGANLGMRVNLTSNGILMDKERARQWIDAGLRSASFSLDGVDRKMHDQIRGMRGAFKRTVRAIGILRRESERRGSKLAIRINMVLSRHNLDQLPGVVQLAGELGAVDVLPMPIDGKHVERPTQLEIKAFNQQLVPRIHELRKLYGMPLNTVRLYPFGRHKEERLSAARGDYALGYYQRHRCYAPYLHTFISHDGDVFACCMTRQRTAPLGNLHHESLADIFRGRAYHELRRVMECARLSACSRCDQFLFENRLIEQRLQQDQVVREDTTLLEMNQ